MLETTRVNLPAYNAGHPAWLRKNPICPMVDDTRPAPTTASDITAVSAVW